MEITFDNRSSYNFSEDYYTLARKVVEKAREVENLKENLEICISIVDNPEIQTINKKFRKINKATDVLSFPVYASKKEIQICDDELVLIGDVIICNEKVFSQAESYNHSPYREFAFLVVHGFLHLIGYDHQNEFEEKEMFKKQEYVLDLLDIKRS